MKDVKAYTTEDLLQNEIVRLKQMLFYCCGELTYIDQQILITNHLELEGWWKKQKKIEEKKVIDIIRPNLKDHPEVIVQNLIKEAEKTHAISRFDKHVFFPKLVKKNNERYTKHKIKELALKKLTLEEREILGL